MSEFGKRGRVYHVCSLKFKNIKKNSKKFKKSLEKYEHW